MEKEKDFQYLLTTIKKTKQEISDLIHSLNLKGELLIGNQMMAKERTYVLQFDGLKITVFDLPTKGVSKNRNFLLKKSNAKFVSFMDDDMSFIGGNQQLVENIVLEKDIKCVRFNVVSSNLKRPIKKLNKKGFVGFRHLSSYGVLGLYFNRRFLIENRLLFNEDIGPGTSINHGEDGVFIHNFLKKGKIFSNLLVAFNVSNLESTWHNKKRNIENELTAHGYIYFLLFGKAADIRSIIFLLVHLKLYPKEYSYFSLRKYMKNGIKRAKEEKKCAY